jgi:hypothetical protein
MKSLAGRWQQITELKVELEEIIYLIREMTRCHDVEENAGFFTSIAILRERYRGEENSVDRMFCVFARIQCLSALMKDERIHGWTMETKGQSAFPRTA